MAKAIVVIGFEFKTYKDNFPAELQRAVQKWQSVLKSLNDAIIERIKVRLGDGTNIDPTQYVNELANPAVAGWKAFAGLPGNNDPSAVIGALKHELRVKGGAYKYITNVQNAFAKDPTTGKSYFMNQVDAAASSDKIKNIFAALQVVGARHVEKTLVPAVIMALAGDRRYAYLLENNLVSGYAGVGIKVISANNQITDFTGMCPGIQPHKAKFARAFLMGAIVERYHLAVAAANLREVGVINDTELQNYLKQINEVFKDISAWKRSGLADLAIGYVDPLDSTLKPIDTWSDRRDKAALAVCLADGTDTCSEVKAYWSA